MSSWVQILTRLIVHGCGNLKELFPDSMIVTEELREKKIGNTIVFPKLNYLEMKQLAKLKRFCSGCYIEFPTLSEFKISKCPELMAFIFNDKVKVPSLKTLKISSMDNLKMVWDNQLAKNSIPKLKSLQVQECYKVLTWLQWNMCESFSSLETLDVSDCGSLEEIFQLHTINSEERHLATSTQSKELYTTVLSFANLQNLKVSKCRSLKSLFSVLNGAKDRGEAKEMHATTRFVFPKLASLKLYKLPELRTFYPARYTVEWPVLRRLQQCDCDENISFSHRNEFSSMWNTAGLEICVERIWLSWLLPVMSSSFRNLTKLVVYGCGNLQELFPSSNLVKEELKENKMQNAILFPKLEFLKMEHLANLTRLCSKYYIEFPSLKECNISNCHELKAFIFDHKVKVPSLTKLKISSMDNLRVIWDNQLPENSIPKLKSLEVQRCYKLLSLLQWNMCESFSSLETLDVSDCDSLEEIFDLHAINSEERHLATSTQSKELYTTVLSFANLQNLKVSKCRSLKSLFSVLSVAKDKGEAEETHATARFVFPKLISLELYKLPELRTFYPTRYTVEWPVLRRLQQCDCDKNILMQRQSFPYRNEFSSLRNMDGLEIPVERIWLSWLLPVMSSSFQNLTKLVVYGCGNLQELFPSSNLVKEELKENKMQNAILFPKLEFLKMEHLANLSRLCSEYYIEFPSLKEFNISNCSELKAFIFDHKVKVPNLTKLKISSMDNLTMIWDNQLPENSIPKLKSLEVQGCYKVLTLLQWNMCESFSSLETLDVSDCGSLKEIFDLHAINSEERHLATSTQFKELYTTVLSFANLENLKVSECGSLIFVFSELTIAKDRGEAEEMHAIARFVFPKLTSLQLYKLPELRNFYPARYTMEWPVLRRLQQCNCDENILMQQQLFSRQKEFFNLQNRDGLEIHVERIWLSWLLPMMSSNFQNLTKLVVCGCGNLQELFPSSNLVKEELKENKMQNAILFPKLEFLRMECLANLTRLCSEYYIEFPSLKECNINNCPELKAFIFDHKVIVPSLTKLKISSMDNLKMIWDNQLPKNSIPKLKSLQVQGCYKILTLLQRNMCESFSSLETLDVSDCGSLEDIFDLHAINSKERHLATSTQSKELYTTVLSFANLQNLNVSECRSLKSLFSISNGAKDRGETEEMHATTRFVFPKLTFLGLYKLPELRTFYPARYTVEWPILRRLWQCDCHISDMNKNILMLPQPFPHKNEFSSIWNTAGLEICVERIWLSWLLPVMSSSFRNLTKLVVYGCGNLQELFPSSNLVKEELKENKMQNATLFPKLEFLKMEHLANLTRLCSEYYIEFPSLKECNISNCPELKAFIFDHKVKVPSLTKLKISSMDNLRMIWDNQLPENSVPKLKSLQVKGCQKLLTLVRSNLDGRFLSLETLNVSDCGSLEEIFDLHEINSEERHFITVTQSKELYATVLSFANLRYLKVSECGSLKSLFSISNVAKESVAVKEAHATAKFVFPKLTSLKLHKLPELRTFYPGRYTVEWPILRSLRLWDYGILDTDDEDQMQHLLFLVKKAIPCLKKLILSGSELMMMWQGQDPEPLFRNFKILEVLDESKANYLLYESQAVLHYIGDVKYMWKQNFKLDLILPNFEKIVVGRCDIFISLMPPSASFRNLTSLEVNDCNSLEHIGTFSTAKNLVRLVSLGIYRCKKIVEVLRNQEDVTGDKILFSNLKRLSLEDLPSLTSFCSWNFTLEFPSLEELEVRQCPSMKIFSQGEVTTPKLHEVKSDWRSIKLCPDVDVSTAIQQLHEQKQVAESFTE